MSSLPTEPKAGGAIIAYGSLQLDRDGYSVRIGGGDLPVTLTEFLLLEALIESPYQVLTRERLSMVFRSDVLLRTPERPPSARAIDTHVSRLRAKLRRAGYDCIRTMRFVGYRFVPPECGSSASP